MDGRRLDLIATFEREGAGDDGYGNPGSGSWSPLAGLTRVPVGFRPEYGREKIAAGRLESNLSGVLTIDRFTASAGITPADRVTFNVAPLAGVTCAIRSIVAPDFYSIEMTIEAGVAA
jgi:hypothetical protein